MSNIRIFLCGAVFIASTLYTRSYNISVMNGEWPSLFYAISANISAALMLGSIILFLYLSNKEQPQATRRRRRKSRIL